MNERLINEIFAILKKQAIPVNKVDKLYNWIEFDDLYFIDDKELIKIIPTYDTTKIKYNDDIYLEAQYNLYNYNLTHCIFFYCYIKDNSIEYYTFNIHQKMPDITKYLYKQYIYYQKNTIHKYLSINNKRTRLQYKHPNLVLPKIVIDDTINHKKFVSASRLKNYVWQDTLCDWLDEYGKNKRYSPNQSSNQQQSFKNTNAIFQQGYEFEYNIVNKIKARFPNQYIEICDDAARQSLQIGKYYQTIYAINQRIPIIFQGVLHNNINNTFGVPDIIIRSDYINKLIPNNIDIECATDNPTYRIIDIKSSNLKLRAGSNCILNTPMTKYYKTQLCLYNEALGLIQKYTPNQAYILANSYMKNKERYDTFENLAVINYDDDDAFILDLYYNAVKWIKYMRKYGADWDPYKPHIAELLPNMKNTYDTEWQDFKHKLISKRSDITELWQCSVKHRNIALSNGVNCWRSMPCMAVEFGFKSGETTRILDKIIMINQNSYKGGPIHPNKIKNNMMNWQTVATNEFFVDFETIVPDDILFMIGVGFVKNGEWNYKQFLINELTQQEEARILLEFVSFIKSHNNPKLFHWGHYENYMLAKKLNAYKFELVDMLKIFKEEPVVVRGALNFSLKSIAKALYNHKLINTIWDTQMDGKSASYEAKKAYASSNPMKAMQKISSYNEADCKVLWGILTILRNMV